MLFVLYCVVVVLTNVWNLNFNGISNLKVLMLLCIGNMTTEWLILTRYKGLWVRACVCLSAFRLLLFLARRICGRSANQPDNGKKGRARREWWKCWWHVKSVKLIESNVKTIPNCCLYCVALRGNLFASLFMCRCSFYSASSHSDDDMCARSGLLLSSSTRLKHITSSHHFIDLIQPSRGAFSLSDVKGKKHEKFSLPFLCSFHVALSLRLHSALESTKNRFQHITNVIAHHHHLTAVNNSVTCC